MSMYPIIIELHRVADPNTVFVNTNQIRAMWVIRAGTLIDFNSKDTLDVRETPAQIQELIQKAITATRKQDAD